MSSIKIILYCLYSCVTPCFGRRSDRNRSVNNIWCNTFYRCLFVTLLHIMYLSNWICPQITHTTRSKKKKSGPKCSLHYRRVLMTANYIRTGGKGINCRCTRHDGISWGELKLPSLTAALDWSEWSASRPGRFTPRTNAVGGWVGLRAGLDFLETRQIICPCRESNHDFLVTHPVAPSLQGLSCPRTDSCGKNFRIIYSV